MNKNIEEEPDTREIFNMDEDEDEYDLVKFTVYLDRSEREIFRQICKRSNISMQFAVLQFIKKVIRSGKITVDINVE